MKKILLACLFLLFIGSAVAAPPLCDFNASPITSLAVSVEASSSNCALFSWTRTDDALYTSADFNNYMVYYDSDTNPVITGDFNTDSTSYRVCPIEPGERVTLTVSSYDGNAEGMRCTIDANASFGLASTTGAVEYLIYAIFTAIGGLVLLIILAVLAMMILGKFKLGGMLPK